jgi:hypothetical protein
LVPLSAVITSITPIPLKRKVILKAFDLGEIAIIPAWTLGQAGTRLIAAQLTERNIDKAAKAVGISPNTLLNWMEVPEFQVAYREARRGPRPRPYSR